MTGEVYLAENGERLYGADCDPFEQGHGLRESCWRGTKSWAASNQLRSQLKWSRHLENCAACLPVNPEQKFSAMGAQNPQVG